jgi:hypothetical protein
MTEGVQPKSSKKAPQKRPRGGEADAKLKVENEDISGDSKTFTAKPGMTLIVLGLPEDVNKKIFRQAACKVVRKAQVELIKEVGLSTYSKKYYSKK